MPLLNKDSKIIQIIFRNGNHHFYSDKSIILGGFKKVSSGEIPFGGNSIWASGEIQLDQNSARASKQILQSHDRGGSGSSLPQSEIKLDERETLSEFRAEFVALVNDFICV